MASSSETEKVLYVYNEDHIVRTGLLKYYDPLLYSDLYTTSLFALSIRDDTLPSTDPTTGSLSRSINAVSFDVELDFIAYENTVKNVFGSSLIALWPLWETSGSLATDISGQNNNAQFVSVALGQNGIGEGHNAPYFSAGSSCIDLYSTDLASDFSGAEGSWVIWARISDIEQLYSNLTKYIGSIYTTSNNRIIIWRSGSPVQYNLQYIASGSTVGITNKQGYSSIAWLMFSLSWSTTGSFVRGWINKDLVFDTAIPTPWQFPGILSNTATALGTNFIGPPPLVMWKGQIAFCALGNQPIEQSDVDELFFSDYNMKGIFFLGDSKTSLGNNWTHDLGNLLDSRSSSIKWSERPVRYAAGGWSLSNVKTTIDANLSAETLDANIVCLNIGANDVVALPAEATWKGNLISVINSLLAKWPNVKIYIALPWTRGETADCNSLATWITDVVLTYPNNVYIGPDERDWLENGDDGVTYTTDGIHYNTAGQVEAANQWQSIIST